MATEGQKSVMVKSQRLIKSFIKILSTYFELLPVRMESQSVPHHAWNRISKHENWMKPTPPTAKQINKNKKIKKVSVTLLIKFTHNSPTIDEFRDKDLGDSS